MKLRTIAILAALAAALATPTLAGNHGDEVRGKPVEKLKEGGEKAVQRTEEAGEAAEGRGAEMRERRDERKAIMDEAKGAAEPGTPRKGKKPWWRFWESDEEWEAAEG